MSKELREIVNKNCNIAEVRKEIRTQYIVCEGLLKPLSADMVKDLCKLKSAIQVCNALREYKLS